MFKATEVERKMREINLLIDMKINLFLCRTSDYHFLLSLQWFSWDSLATGNVSSRHAQNFWMVNKSWWQKKCGRNHILYPHKIVQTSELGRVAEKIIGTQWLLVSSICISLECQETPNGQYSQSTELLSNKLLKCYSNAFKNHWNSTGTICLNIIFQTWGLFWHTESTELHD